MQLARFTCDILLRATAIGLTLASAGAQNGSNYHALSNGLDIVYLGVGAGGTQTASDGIGQYIPGEDLRGAVRNGAGTLAYRQNGWREAACVLNAPPGGGAPTLHFPLIVWTELGGTNCGHTPVVFQNPAEGPLCAGFPLGGSGGFIPFGTPAGSTAAFVVAGLPSALGSGMGTLVIPNEKLLPSSAGGTATLLAVAIPSAYPIASTGFCWQTQFQWVPSALSVVKDANNGWWHWTSNNPLGNQYWGFSGDEANLWKSHTIASDSGQTAVLSFLADAEYASLSLSVQPNTNLATSPAGFYGDGAYYINVENYRDRNGQPTWNINGGHDMGGHGTLSLSGVNGVPSVNTGLGAQDPAGVGGISPAGGPLLPTLGFWTYDNRTAALSGIPLQGSKRLAWLCIDFDHIFGLDPRQSGEATVLGGTVRVPCPVPVSFPQFPQPFTRQMFDYFSHEVSPCPGCAAGSPTGFGPGTFGVPDIQGGSLQLPLSGDGTLCASVSGAPMAITYGTSGLKGPAGVGAPHLGLTWQQHIAATGGHKTFFIFD